MDRFSRLYPLHIATFIIVAGLQYIYSRDHSSYFIYQANDAYHAFLNVLLIPAWGFEEGTSFNAPIWSVSIEVILYIIFFFICLMKGFRYFLVPALILLGYMVYPNNYKIGDGLITFFSGGVAFWVINILKEKSNSKVSLLFSLVLAAFSWGVVLASTAWTNYLVIGLALPVSVMFIASL